LAKKTKVAKLERVEQSTRGKKVATTFFGLPNIRHYTLIIYLFIYLSIFIYLFLFRPFSPVSLKMLLICLERIEQSARGKKVAATFFGFPNKQSKNLN
jgi:hypothetical protein